MNNKHQMRTWAYALVAGLAIAVAVALAALALDGHENATPAAAAFQPVREQTLADRACIRVVARRSAARPHRRDAQARADERTCRRLLASNAETGFFGPASPASDATDTAVRTGSKR